MPPFIGYLSDKQSKLSLDGQYTVTTIHMDLLSFVKETSETVSWRTKVGHIHIFVKDISETISWQTSNILSMSYD